MTLTLSSHRELGTVTIAVGGDIDLESADQLERRIADCVAGDAGVVEVNLSGVRFIDSAGINTLLNARRDADAHGKTFRVTEASGFVRELLEMTGVWLYLSDAVR